MQSDQVQYGQQDQLHVNNMQTIQNNQPQLVANIPPTVQRTTVSNQQNFRPVGPHNMQMTCPSCHCHIKTNVRHRSTAKTHIACLLFTVVTPNIFEYRLFMCDFRCCCCLPYCMDSCRNANHFCPMCQTFLGTYTKSSVDCHSFEKIQPLVLCTDFQKLFENLQMIFKNHIGIRIVIGFETFQNDG